jgi:hypothetical protein
MLSIPPNCDSSHEMRLTQKNVAVEQRPRCKKWLRYYLDFCHKYAFEPTDRRSFPAFQEKLWAKNQSESQCQQAYHAVALYSDHRWVNCPKLRFSPCMEVICPINESHQGTCVQNNQRFIHQNL